MRKIINVTPHALSFVCSSSGTYYTLDPSGVVINATPHEVECPEHSYGISLVKTTFSASEAEDAKLTLLEQQNPGAIVVGSIIAAQAFPGRILAMTPAHGFGRVPPAERRMRDDKFITFETPHVYALESNSTLLAYEPACAAEIKLYYSDGKYYISSLIADKEIGKPEAEDWYADERMHQICWI
ncbi:MAG: hypothetical protein DDT29_00872 [Dehalococcoidia bacterium]|nr:hypothetical protein [Bacillota bacterium]